MNNLTITDLQKWVEEDWKKNSKGKPSVELQLLYIIEEFGEVAEAIRKSGGHKQRKDAETDLGSEFADMLISIVTLANSFDIDITAEIEKFQARMAHRHATGF